MPAALRIFGAFVVMIQALVFTVALAGPAGAIVAGPLVATHSDLCVTVTGSSTAAGAAAIQDVCDGGSDQSIELKDAGGGTVELLMGHSGLCLRPADEAAGNGTAIVQGACDGSASARWTSTSVAGGLRLQVAASGLCLDVFGGDTTAGAALIQWPCHGNANQVFDYQGVDVGGGGGGGCSTSLTVEAEDGELAGDMTTGNDPAASGGAYVHVPDGTGNAWSFGSTNQASYCFTITQGGTYRIETQSRGLDGLSDSFRVTVDDQPATGFLWDMGIKSTYVTDNVSNRGGADPVIIDLDPGEVTITFHQREDGSRLDTITLVPIDVGGGGCSTSLTVEAEDGELAGDMTTGNDPAASGGAYVHVPDGTGNAWSFGSPNQASYCFTITQGGTYRIETQSRGLDGLSDSFRVTVDDQPATGFLWDMGIKSTYVTDNVSDRGGADPVIIDLDPGEVTITFHQREDGSRLDTITLVRTGGGTDPGNTSGSWGPVVNVGLVPVAMANVPSGEVLMWSAYGRFTFGGSNGYTQTAMYNPSTGALRDRQVSNTQHDMFCPGIANLADGRVLVSGGSGNAETSIYNPATDAWEDAADMNIGRGYQGNVTLGDGSVLTVGGSWSGGRAEKASEIYRNGSWTTLPGIVGGGTLETADAQGQYRADNHMWLFAWTDDQVFHAGPARTMNWLNVAGQGSVQPAGTRESDDAMNGNAVMYDVGKILTMGGGPDYVDSPAPPRPMSST